MKNKSEISVLLPNFYNLVQNQFNKLIKIIRSDNGLEFKQTDFFNNKGIIHQQNAIVERKHQHLLNVARSLRFESNVPLYLWGDYLLQLIS